MSSIRNVVIVGGVAGGASAAARLRRLDEDMNIVVLERSGYVSFANCGLPYHLSGTIADRDDLLLQTPESLWERFRLDVRVRNEVLEIDRTAHTVKVRNLAIEETYTLPYDALILSPGATPIVPAIPGADNGFVLRDVEDLDHIKQSVQDADSALVVGGGFIGLEAAENLREAGLEVTIVELASQVLAPLDPEMAQPIARELANHGVTVELGRQVSELKANKAVLDDGRIVAADLAIFAIGVRPDATLAHRADLRVGPSGGIWVDENQRTSDPFIWAVGDAVEKTDLLDGEATLTPLANIANRQGRRAADSIAGHPHSVQPAQGTAIVKVFGLMAATTGWSEKRLRKAGREFMAIHTHASDHAGYYPDASTMALKLLLDPSNGSILGAQGVGADGVDKRIDVIATAMRAGLAAIDLIDLELAYAPPFGSAKDPINQLGYIAENRLSGQTRAVDWSQVPDLVADGWQLLDVRSEAEYATSTIPGAINVPVDELRERLGELTAPRYVVFCQVGQRAHVAAALLAGHGVEAVNLDGGWRTWCDGFCKRS